MRHRTARFKDIPARPFGRPELLLVEIDRDLGLFRVKIKRKRKTYEVSFSLIASIAYERAVKAEVAERKAAKKAAKATRAKKN